MLVMYWAWGLFPTWLARLAGYALLVLGLVPVAAASSVAVWWCSARWGSRPLIAMIVAMLTGVIVFYSEALLLFFVYPDLFGKPFSSANALPGLITGAIVGYARSGAARGKAV